MFLKKRNETPQPDRAGNPSGCGVFLCFFLHKIAIEQKQTRKAEEVLDAKKKKQKKSLHPPGGELLSAMQVPSDLAFGEPVVTFYGGREVQIENFRRILEYNACRLCVLTQYGRLLLVGEESGLFRIPGGDAGGRENRSGDVSISVMIPIIPMLKRGCAFAEGKGFLERQCADSCDGP